MLLTRCRAYPVYCACAVAIIESMPSCPTPRRCASTYIASSVQTLPIKARRRAASRSFHAARYPTTSSLTLPMARLLRLRDDDFSKGSSCFEVSERAPHLVERKDAVDERPKVIHRNGPVHIGELSTISREDDPNRCRSVVQDIDINR